VIGYWGEAREKRGLPLIKPKVPSKSIKVGQKGRWHQMARRARREGQKRRG